MAIIVKCKKCDKEIEGKAALVQIPLEAPDLPDRFYSMQAEDLVRKIHVCMKCIDMVENCLDGDYDDR